MEKKPPVSMRELIEAIATLHVINGLSWKTSPILNKPFPKSQRRIAQPPILISLVFCVSHLTKVSKHQILSNRMPQ
jgi:hypothetical protein